MPFYPTPNQRRRLRHHATTSASTRGSATSATCVEAIRHAHRPRPARARRPRRQPHLDRAPVVPAPRARTADSPYRAYYVWSDDPVAREGHDAGQLDLVDDAAGQLLHAPLPALPARPRTSPTPAVRDEIAKTVGFWLKLGVSGFRMDAVPFLVRGARCAHRRGRAATGKRWLHALREYALRRRGDAMLMGEVQRRRRTSSSPTSRTTATRCTSSSASSSTSGCGSSLARGEAAPLEEPDPRRCRCRRTTAAGRRSCATTTSSSLDKLDEAERDEVFAAFGPDEGHADLRPRHPPARRVDARRRRAAAADGVVAACSRLPGTPVILYGDEIGMGEDLGWTAGWPSGRRCSGARAGHRSSRGADERLVRPSPSAVRTDAVTSLLAAHRVAAEVVRLVTQRRDTPELGWGTSRLLENEPPALFAHRCDWQGSTVFAVHNLARRDGRPPSSTSGDGRRRASTTCSSCREHRRRAAGACGSSSTATGTGGCAPGGERRRAGTDVGPSDVRHVTPGLADLGLGVVAYGVAVFQRASLGVAGLEAQQRFGAPRPCSACSSSCSWRCTPALQVPVGVVLDRVGSRRMIAAGAALMGVGQLVLAEPHSRRARVVGPRARRRRRRDDVHQRAAAGRRLVPGAAGAAAHPADRHRSARAARSPRPIPLVALLHGGGLDDDVPRRGVAGWPSRSLVAVGLRNAPPGRAVPAPPRAGAVRRPCARAWREPGTRLGLWTHFVTQFSGTVFALLWGYPFLVAGRGPLARRGGRAADPARARRHGHRAGARAARRAVAAAALDAGARDRRLDRDRPGPSCWPGRGGAARAARRAGLVLATNGPGSMIGFDYARTENQPERIGSATGIVNVGGFVASLLTILADRARPELASARAAPATTRSTTSASRSRCSTCSGRSGWSACCTTRRRLRGAARAGPRPVPARGPARGARPARATADAGRLTGRPSPHRRC